MFYFMVDDDVRSPKNIFLLHITWLYTRHPVFLYRYLEIILIRKKKDVK